MGKMLAITLACSVAGQCFAYEDTAVVMGLTYAGKTQGEPGVLDIDNDGDLDIIVPAHQAPSPIMRNDGEAYVQIDQLPHADRHGCVTADINRDGWTDAYCILGNMMGMCGYTKSDEVWINRNGRLVNETRLWGAAGTIDRGRDAAFFGQYLFVANEVSDCGSKSRVYRNNGRRFIEEPIPVGGAVTVATGDINKDGRPEVIFGHSDPKTGRTTTLRKFPGGWQVVPMPWDKARARDIEVMGSRVVTVEAKALTIWSTRRAEYTYPLNEGTDVAVLPDGSLYVVQGENALYDDTVLLPVGGSWQKAETPPQTREGYGDTATAVGACAFVGNGKWHKGTGPVELQCPGAPSS